MSQSERHTLFLVRRLREMGLDLGPETESQGPSANGELPLSATPFDTLGGSFRAQKALFYTLGHSRLKFFQPSPFFYVPALDVSRCESAEQIEAGLRRGWALRLRQLEAAQSWLLELGADVQVAGHGTQLLLPLKGVEGPPARVLSRASIQLPSSGPLVNASLNAPCERSHRPRSDLKRSAELDSELQGAMQQLARRCSSSRQASSHVAPTGSRGQGLVQRVLLVDRDREFLRTTASLLASHGFEIDCFQTPERALGAFRTRSYDLVLAAARMPRGDGLEFTSHVRELPGVENLPIVLLDERFSERQKRAAITAGAAGYFRKPLSWAEIGSRITELLDHTNLRRYERLEAQLTVHNEHGSGPVVHLTHKVARGGFELRANHKLAPNSIERYRIVLPDSPVAVNVEGKVVYTKSVEGDPGLQAGVQVLRFLDDHEPDWIRLIEKLASRTSGRHQLTQL